MIRDHAGFNVNGWPIVGVAFFLLAATGYSVFNLVVQQYSAPMLTLAIAAGVMLLFFLSGFFIVNPNEAKVMQFFGNYVGTAQAEGLRWTIPFFTRQTVSVRIRSFETVQVKVNDNHGNPIIAAAIVVWRVVDSARAVFEVEDFGSYVTRQSEAALRALIMRYPYDAYGSEDVALITHVAEVSEQLKREIQERVDQAGVEIVEARISHLAYSSEIAAAMLQRQQAGAIVAARQKIVEGAVGMVEHALEMLSAKKVVHLDESRKASMVANLLVVLCSERHAQPVLETRSDGDVKQ